MKRNIGVWQLWGFAVTCLGGTILHFLYDLSKQSILIAPFSGVNESTWEHMKLLFWPMFIFAFFQRFYFKNIENYWCIKLRGTLLGLILIPIIFYTYNGAIAPSPDWLNIAIFFITAAIVYIYEAKLFKKESLFSKASKYCFFILCFVALLFLIFTFAQPKINLFKDPITNGYGI